MADIQEHPAKLPHSHDPSKGRGLGQPRYKSKAYQTLQKLAGKKKGRAKIAHAAGKAARGRAVGAKKGQAMALGLAVWSGAGGRSKGVPAQSAMAAARIEGKVKRRAARQAKALGEGNQMTTKEQLAELREVVAGLAALGVLQEHPGHSDQSVHGRRGGRTNASRAKRQAHSDAARATADKNFERRVATVARKKAAKGEKVTVADRGAALNKDYVLPKRGKGTGKRPAYLTPKSEYGTGPTFDPRTVHGPMTPKARSEVMRSGVSHLQGLNAAEKGGVAIYKGFVRQNAKKRQTAKVKAETASFKAKIAGFERSISHRDAAIAKLSRAAGSQKGA